MTQASQSRVKKRAQRAAIGEAAKEQAAANGERETTLKPNAKRGEAVLVIGGHEYLVKASFDVICEIEARYEGLIALTNRIAAGNATQLELATIAAIAVKLSPHRSCKKAAELEDADLIRKFGEARPPSYMRSLNMFLLMAGFGGDPWAEEDADGEEDASPEQ